MRVISGYYKGKKIDGFDIGGTRPTKDRVKESLMAMIQNKIKDSVVLDLFAGSGSLGIEALSNGAGCCYFVDNSKDIIKILKRNLIGIDNSFLVFDDYKSALTEFRSKNIKFDIIFLDPPYHLNILNNAIQLIKDYNLLNKNGIIVCEFEEEVPYSIYNVIKEKKYGKTNIIILKND